MARVRTSRWVGAAAAALAAAALAGCEPGGPLGRDAIDRSSPLYGLRRAGKHDIDRAIREPSDLAFDPASRTLWTVSDESGTLHRIAFDGSPAGPPIDVKGEDLEGVALDPKSGHLFVVDERRRQVTEVTREGAVVNRFTVPGQGSNSGLEGIAYDEAADGFVLANERSPAELIFIDRAGRVTSRARVATMDMSAVAAAPGGKSFVVVGRFEEAAVEVDRQGRQLNRLALNVPGVEGIAFDDRGRLYAVADLGGKTKGELYVFSKGGE